MRSRTIAGLMAAAAVAANLAFVGLGSTFDYPDVLQHPGAEVLADFRAHQGPVMAWFAVLLLGAAVLAPVALGLRRLTTGRLAAAAAVAGVAAAVVQVVGLSRWLLLVPGLADRAADPEQAGPAVERFVLLGRVLGSLVGETLGYLLTAVWTVLVLASLTRRPPTWFVALGAASALLILTGVLVPLDVPGADLANFVGYVLWSVWLVAFAVRLWRSRDSVPAAADRPILAA